MVREFGPRKRMIRTGLVLESTRLILDTHTLLWVDCNDPQLGAMARLQIEVAWRAGSLVVGAISFWDVAMIAERDRISLPTSPERWHANWLRAGLVEIPIDGWIAL